MALSVAAVLQVNLDMHAGTEVDHTYGMDTELPTMHKGQDTLADRLLRQS